MEYTIRKYEESDLDDVMSSWENASALAHPFLPKEFLDTERHNIRNVYMPKTDTWVAESDGKVIGFISLMGNEVGAIFVQPEFHGTGVGWTLMDKARELHRDLEVEVFEENSIGRAFYAKYGFEYLSEKNFEPTGNKTLRLRFRSDE